ncbi:MAG: membrane protein insertion efficiency factor YidD [Actinomycetota bacterium]|nr:membrane protein insertion efficiency factor YidD [Actinomycetota bacterium]
MKSSVLILIKVYQAKISPRLGAGKCRFHPTCSQYAITAIDKYGVFRGGLKTYRRLRRCRPNNYESCIDFP